MAHRVPEGLAFLLDLAVAVEGNDLHELRVHDRAVQALVIVLDDDFPVGGDVVLAGRSDPQLPDPVASQFHGGVRHRRKHLSERGGGSVEIHEHEAVPFLERHRPEPVGLAIEPVFRFDVRRSQQPPVEPVGP